MSSPPRVLDKPLLVKNKDLNRDYNLRSKDDDLALPKPKTNFLKQSFRNSAGKPWNSLPSEVKGGL